MGSKNKEEFANQLRQGGRSALKTEKHHEDVDKAIIKPNHNKVGSKHTYEVVTDIAKANPTFDEFDTVMLAYMFKHIPRAGRKLYPDKDELSSKILDLQKTREYLDAWIDGLLKKELQGLMMSDIQQAVMHDSSMVEVERKDHKSGHPFYGDLEEIVKRVVK